MKITNTEIKDLMIIEPQVFGDDRGWFCESYSKEKFKEAGLPYDFVQDNHSFSTKGVLRGLHFQKPPHAQTKLVRCTRGALWDVAVDLRKNSETYKQWFGLELSQENKKMLLIPEGFAHGFYALEDCEMQYKVTSGYAPQSDSGVLWSDQEIKIDWPTSLANPVISEKDLQLQPLTETQNPF